ncbi:MAG: helix-turn-helix domain-containing protein [Rhodospirillales bacterium]|nr:helix-turn-helix domain-containing protein [Rhodospirillales bacterium]
MALPAATACLAVMKISQQFGQILKDLRNSKSLTQEELAFNAGMSVPYLSDIERGRSSPSLAVIVDLAMALGVHPAELLKGLDPKAAGHGGERKRPRNG